MNESQALAHLFQQLDAGLSANRSVAMAGLEVAEVLDLLGADGRRRVLASAYLEGEPDAYWPAFADPADLWRIVRQVLTTAEARAVSTCPPWCDEHATAHRHSVFEDDREGTGYTVGHQCAHGRYVLVEASETALTAAGPTLLDPPGVHIVLSLEAGEPLTAAAAKDLAQHLLTAGKQLEQYADNPTADSTTRDPEENPR